MRKITLENIIRWVLIMAIQVLVLNNVLIGGYLNPYLYVLIILLLPGSLSGASVLLVGFGTGLLLDFFMNTHGVHAAATTAMAFMRIRLLSSVTGKAYEDLSRPGMNTMGFRNFSIYAGSLILVHHLLLFVLDVFRFGEILTTLYRALLSAALTLALVFVHQLLTQRQRKNAL